MQDEQSAPCISVSPLDHNENSQIIKHRGNNASSALHMIDHYRADSSTELSTAVPLQDLSSSAKMVPTSEGPIVYKQRDEAIDRGEDENDVATGIAELDEILTPYLLRVSLLAGCSGLLFGWDTGIAVSAR